MVSANHKRHWREEARERREALHRKQGAGAALLLVRQFVKAWPPVPGIVVAGYWPMGSEIDCRPLLGELHDAGCHCCLPVVVERDSPLAFRQWRPGMDLVEGAFGIMEPPADTHRMTPEVIVVPLLAFDDRRHRLGYGGGYYDRTLSVLRQEGSIVAIGIAYAGQRVDALPDEGHDQALDRIVTEEGEVV
ncbi:MAG: 5-formyltetrahydrofolate cyclo-ligase [Rhodospirillales bacterium]|nr:5-formyltetrahydrofolate cyclo-ligase [Rhodospirillales bacterium]